MVQLRAAVCLLLTLGTHVLGADSTNGLAPLLHLSPKSDGDSVRRVLFGGEPHLSFCKQKSNPGLNDFVTEVRKHLGRSSTKIKTVIVSCGEKMSSSGKVFAKSLKLKTRQEGEPVVVWSVNGDPPLQLPTSAYTSALEQKGKAADAQSGKVSVKLDAKELAEYALKRKNPKLTAVSTQKSLDKHCLALKYQVCAVILHKGVLPAETRKKFLKIANGYRYVRFVAIDKSKHQLVGVPEGKPTQDLNVVAVRRSDYVYAGPLTQNTPSQSAEKREDKSGKKRLLKQASSVQSIGPKVRVSTALKQLIDPEVVYSPEKRLSAFRKGELEDHVSFTSAQPDELVYLLRRGDQAYALGIEEITQYLVGKETFDQQLDDKALQLRQQSFLLGKIRVSTKKNRKSRELKARAYEGKVTDRKELTKFLKSAAEPEETSMKRLTTQPKLQTKRKASAKKNEKKRPKPKKKPKNKRGASRNQQKPKDDQVERERQRRAEMEQEALESGAVAFEAEPEDDDSDSCDDPEDIEEETADVIDLSDDDAPDTTIDENGEDEDELDLDDF